MPKALRYAVSTLAGLSLIALVGSFLAREPLYEGVPLSTWLARLRSEDEQLRRESESAFRRFGGAITRQLANQLSSSDSALRHFFASRHVRINRAGDSKELMTSGNLKRAMAAAALGFRGTAAQDAIPTLQQATTSGPVLVASYARAALHKIEPAAAAQNSSLQDSSKSDEVLREALFLYALGTNRQNIAVQLTNWFKRSNESAQFDAAEFLCANEMEPAVSIPVLCEILQNGSRAIKVNALNAVIVQLMTPMTTSFWKSEIQPYVIACLTNTDVNVRGNAVAALSICYPVDRVVLPTPIWRSLLHDPNAGISAWAASLTNRGQRKSESIVR